MPEIKTITDHDEIRNWVAMRGGRPAIVASSGNGGVLHIDFGDAGAALEEIPWEEFFELFEKNQLAFLCQERTKEGTVSRFNKFVARH